MVVAHGKERWPEVVGGCRWLVKWPKYGRTHSYAQNRMGAILAFVGPLVGVLVAVHGA